MAYESVNYLDTPSNTTFHYLRFWESSVVADLVVVTCFIQYRDKFLALRRARRDEQYGLWGIPGGKLESLDRSPALGLSREVREETGIVIDHGKLTLLGTALSRTPCDGEYGLYLFHVALTYEPEIVLGPAEHSECRWVTSQEFEALPLLTAQREAYALVSSQLNKLIQANE